MTAFEEVYYGLLREYLYIGYYQEYAESLAFNETITLFEM